MSVTELLPTFHELNRADKLVVTQFLINELAQEETPLLENGKSYPVWSPHNAFEAAEALQKMLEEGKRA
jgi:hypothetical protein